ncbi:hypothetical protein GJ744_003152 [Endocarpon pusillum]|uniref:Cytochrome P450 n=1 Tax=Endocarpon pusillum TaxID=364733 RepID=A0A8H7APG1_9EURO|nr:hypothetical protein GJ744_003152 [Endocarpon pusillum]
MSNLFIYLLASYETTANTILYGLIVLALRPELQSRVIGEIDQVYADAARAGRTGLTYGDDFERLQYTYGFMEKPSASSPVWLLIAKWSTKPPISALPLHHRVEPRHICYLLVVTCTSLTCFALLGTLSVRRSSLLTLDPGRWLEAPAAAPAKDATIPEKQVVAAHKTSQVRDMFLIFSDSARACLRSKFAQAESTLRFRQGYYANTE